MVRWPSAVVVQLCQSSKHLIIQSFENLLLGKYPVRKGEDRDVVLFITVCHLTNITTVAQLTLKTSATKEILQGQTERLSSHIVDLQIRLYLKVLS